MPRSFGDVTTIVLTLGKMANKLVVRDDLEMTNRLAKEDNLEIMNGLAKSDNLEWMNGLAVGDNFDCAEHTINGFAAVDNFV